MEERERSELEGSHEFFIAATSTRQEWSDLTAEDSPWNIRLVNDRGDVLTPFAADHDPPGVEKIRRPTPTEHAYFPYLTEFRRAFVIRFPRALPDGTPFLGAGVEAFSLEFSGALGRAELRWSSTGD